MKCRSLILSIAVVAGLANSALAQAPLDEQQRPGRYTMQPTEGGFLRLDTATGDVALCARVQATFECKPVKDDRDLQTEISRLSAENKELQAENKRLEGLLGIDGGPAKPQRKLELPSEEDVDKALSYLERMFKKFRDKMKEFDTEGGSPKGTPL